MKVMIAMSGGVDSSVAAYLMKARGFDCVGATMKLFRGGGDEDARRVAEGLGIPHYVFDFSGLFERAVVRHFAESYERGLTPNPCVECNRSVKFGALFSKAMELGCDFLATGHYARIEGNEISGFSLKKALDGAKDQSYFLYPVTRERLPRILFPLGGMTKKEVRSAAEALGFVNARKRESQDICFITGENYSDFIERYTGKPQLPGNFVDSDGRTLGCHRGLIRYTIGQRKGLGVASAAPLYVCAKDARSNTVTLGGEKMLYSAAAEAVSCNWLRPARPGGRVTVKTRYRQTEQWATVTEARDDFVRVEFDEPQRAVAPGQALVLYDGDTLICGGQGQAPISSNKDELTYDHFGKTLWK